MRSWRMVVLLLPLLTARATAQEGQMQDMAMDGPHITLTPTRPLRAGDQARADSIVAIARAAAGKYRDVAVAEADGFRRFAPRVKQQRMYHYTSRTAGLKARFGFDAASPTALLYREAGGKLELVGVMYTAPASASLEELDRRIPLSIARWHQHTNICLPPRGEDAAAAAMTGPHPEFGPRGSIATEAECAEAGGRWKERMLNWMVHVNVFTDDPAGVWHDAHGGMRHH